MIRKDAWSQEILRIIALVFVAVFVFSFWSSALLGLAVGLLLIVVYFLTQLLRVQKWLNSEEADPPESTGVWGGIFDHIYRMQRQNEEAQARLESALDYLQDSLKSMRDAAVIVDKRGAIAWINHSAHLMLGIRAPEDVGRPLLNLLRSPELADYVDNADFSRPLRLDPSPEQERCLLFEISSFGEGDRLIFVRDNTQQYRLELMRRDFVSDVSHELRTPLTVIKGYIETLLDSYPLHDERLKKTFVQVCFQTDRMESLLKDLIWLAQIESFENEEKSTKVELAEVIKEVSDDLTAAWPNRDIELRLDESISVHGDYRELHSAVSNLMVNALNYGNDSAPVRVSWQTQGASAVMSVEDEGDGIETQHLARLTERFYRVDHSRSQKTGGTGLGLAIVKHVAMSHDAELKIESEVGRGSRFQLIFKQPINVTH